MAMKTSYSRNRISGYALLHLFSLETFVGDLTYVMIIRVTIRRTSDSRHGPSRLGLPGSLKSVTCITVLEPRDVRLQAADPTASID